jgi:2-polyprenyl-3-methyl-5-hydroxy-6-metoxy-1,4-benzoquinol methylase
VSRRFLLNLLTKLLTKCESLMAFDRNKLVAYPGLRQIVDQVLTVWPEHDSYCETRFRDDPPGFLARSEDLAGLVLKLAGDDLAKYCSDYRWMCEEFVAEEYFFRQNGRYRLSTFKEAYEQVYNNPEYMSKYVRGILISQFIWSPHARAFDYFRTHFLPGNPSGTRHLEVGPGHGLFLYFASQDPSIASLEAWDVSQSSIAATRHALDKFNVTRPIALREQDVLKAPERDGTYDSAIISEVLEHLERPDIALATLRKALRPGGRIFINVPVNSPAPDHIYLWTGHTEFVDWVKAQGFEIESTQFLPVTGATLERAAKRKLSISCIVIARRPM